ncbi:DUF4129 domain-containing protein [Streptomyces xanthii]|uniref:DUF4129 domain-containing protein n=1 Tax=Streptomyces xanthii TaxID=2768069 RepID=A0A7H1BAX1_9ACTN|nr:DUF4129 domain-containing protein [Streptomyces xanthii]QNS05876.1 DUF4129 domain-containing protein [Streptomyces xanthii]
MSALGGVLTAPALLTRAGGDEPPVTISREAAREAARDELSKPAYHENDPSWYMRALDAFWDWVGDLFSAASGATPGGAVGLVVIVLAVLAAGAALWWRLGTPRRLPRTEAPLFDDRPSSAAEHRAAAEAHAAQAHWNQAVQERMRALVRSLEERALLDPRPGRTADEAATEAARPLPGHAEALRAAARTFDDIAYGGRTATAAMYAALTTLDTEVTHTTPTLPEGALR